MNKEILLVVEAVSNEKGVDADVIFEAIEAALEMATKKRAGEDIDVKVTINRKTGDYSTTRRWLVIEDAADDEEGDEGLTRLTLTAAKARDAATTVGQHVEEPM